MSLPGWTALRGDLPDAAWLRRAAPVLLIASALVVLRGPVVAFYELELKSLPGSVWLHFYPLLFLPLFVKRAGGEFSRGELLEIAFGLCVVLGGQLSGIRMLVWLGGVWTLLTLARAVGWRVGRLGKLLFLLVPPLTLKGELVFGFALRLFLSARAGDLLHLLGSNALVRGNEIMTGGQVFSVDPACEGLKMFTALLLIVLILLQRRGEGPGEGAVLRAGKIGLIMVFAGACWMVANLFRIVILVGARIPPESVAHGLWGVFLFVTCVLFPVLLLDILLFGAGSPDASDGSESAKIAAARSPIVAGRRAQWIVLATAIILVGASFTMRPRRTTVAFAWPTSLMNFEYRQQRSFQGLPFDPSGIAVYEPATRDGAPIDELLLIKRNLNPLRIGHPPRRCWEGAGFKISAERERIVPGIGRVRLARIEKEGDRFQMAWWYQPDTSEPASGSEIFWRWRRILFGTRAVQVNIVAPDEKRLLQRALAARETLGGHKNLW